MAFGIDFSKADEKEKKSRELLYATLSKKNTKEKQKALKSPDLQHWLSLLTPTQYADLFPGYYKKALPDLGKSAMSGQARYGNTPAIPASSGYSVAPRTAGGQTVQSRRSNATSTSNSGGTNSNMSTSQSSDNEPEATLKKSLKAAGIDVSSQSASNSKSLAGLREKLANALKSNEDSMNKALAMAMAETASQGKQAHTGFFESIFNRAISQNKEKIDDIISNVKYYEPLQNGKFEKYYNMIKSGHLDKYTKDRLEDIKLSLNEVIAGSNITRGGMHNASAGVAAKVKEGGYDADVSSVTDLSDSGKSPETYYAKKFANEVKARKLINKLYDEPEEESTSDKEDRPWTSLEKPPTKEEVDSAIKSGIKHFDFDPGQPGAKEASEYIAQKGGVSVAYSQGGKSKEWGEKEVDLTSDKGKEFIKNEVERVMKSGQYGALHIDNIDRVKDPKALYDIVKQVEKDSDGKLSVIPKNNPGTFAEMYSKYGKDLKPAPYAWMENVNKGMDKSEVEKFTKAFPGKAYAVEFAKTKDKGQSTSTKEAEQLSGKHGLAGVYHMKSEEKNGENTGFESRGAKFISGGNIEAPAGVNENFLKFWDKMVPSQKKSVAKQLEKMDVSKLNSMADEAYKQQKDAVLYEPADSSGVKFDIKGGNIKGIDPKLLNLMKESSKDLPEGWKVSMISGKDARSTGTSNHPGGIAMDVQIYDNKGKLMPYDRNSPGWKHYEQLYRSAVIRGKEMYPDEKFIWGGAWQSAAAGNGDPMHYQIVNKKIPFSSTTSGKYSFENGLNPNHDFAKTPQNQLSKDEREAWDKRVRENILKEKVDRAAKSRAQEEQTGSVKPIPLSPPKPGAVQSVVPTPQPIQSTAPQIKVAPAQSQASPQAAQPQQSAPQPETRTPPAAVPTPNVLKPDQSSIQHAPPTPSASRAVEDTKVSENTRHGDGSKAI